MNNKGINNGLLAGLISVILLLVFYFINPGFFLSYGGYIIILVYAFFMYKAGLETRTESGGFIGFGAVLGPVFLTFVIASFMVSLFNYILYNFIDASLLDLIMEKAVEQIEKLSGLLGEEGVEAALEKLEEDGIDFNLGKVALGWAFGLIVPGIIIALIEAAILKKTDKSGV